MGHTVPLGFKLETSWQISLFMWSPSVQDTTKVIVAYVQLGMLSPSGPPALCAINLIALDLESVWVLKEGPEQSRLWNSSI